MRLLAQGDTRSAVRRALALRRRDDDRESDGRWGMMRGHRAADRQYLVLRSCAGGRDCSERPISEADLCGAIHNLGDQPDVRSFTSRRTVAKRLAVRPCCTTSPAVVSGADTGSLDRFEFGEFTGSGSRWVLASPLIDYFGYMARLSAGALTLQDAETRSRHQRLLVDDTAQAISARDTRVAERRPCYRASAPWHRRRQ
jgi:hypothetical protein